MKLILMGDVNLMDVTNPAEPFRKILGELHAADVVFGNLECMQISRIRLSGKTSSPSPTATSCPSRSGVRARSARRGASTRSGVGCTSLGVKR